MFQRDIGHANHRILLAALLFLPDVALAAKRPSLFDFLEAHDRLDIRIEAAEAPLPRLSDPVDGPTIRTAFDMRIFEAVDWDDLPLALDVCDAGRDSMDAYVGPRDIRASRQALEEHSARYQDEYALMTTFTLRCYARLGPAGGRFWDRLAPENRTAARRDGVRIIQQGVGQIYVGLLLWQSDQAIRQDNRDRLLTALAESNSGLGSVLTPDQRSALAVLIARIAVTASPTDRVRLKRLGAELAAMPCTGLCAV